MLEKYDKAPRALLGTALIVLSSACGTILHPERRGQRGGRIDAGIAVLDAVGLLFFIIPGVIAFAVDFTNGTIYLPGGGRGFGRAEPVKIKFDPSGDAKAAVEAVLRERTGLAVRLDDAALSAVELKSADELPALFAAEAQTAAR